MKLIATDTFFQSFKKMINSTKPWYFGFWKNLYYDFKRYSTNLFKYHKIVKKMYPWDGASIYQMVKFQLEILLPNIENGMEEEVSRDKKVKDIKRLIELLDNYEKENYADRCGYDANWNFYFEEKKDGLVEMLTDETEEQKEKNQKALLASYELEKQEIAEIGELFKKIPTWWD